MTGVGEIGRDISSFTEFVRDQAPHLLPHNRVRTVTDADRVPHGTTIVAIAYPGGVLIAGDRRATAGNLIASRDMQKVFIADEYSAVGIAGTAGLAVEMVRLFAVELEHYEKIEGIPLTFAGKANRLAGMVRSNMELAMQGLAAIPLLVGYDEDNQRGRIFGFDVAGDRHEEHGGYQAIGSGSVFAKSSIKKLYRADLDAGAALAIAVEALYDAADDDSATGGPDLTRGLYPTAVRVDADGAVELSSAELADAVRTVIERRTAELGGGNIGEQPGGSRL